MLRKIKRLISNIAFWVKVPFVLVFFLLGLVGVPYAMYLVCCICATETEKHRY